MTFLTSKQIKISAAVLAAILTLTTLGGSVSFAAKDPAAELEKKEEKLEKIQNKKEDVYEEMNELSSKIDKQEKGIKKVQKSIDKKTKEIKATEKSLRLMKKKIRTRKNNLNQRIRAMYKNGVIGYLDIILNSSDVTELITNVDMVQKIYEADQGTLDTLVEHRMQIEAQEATLKKEKKELKEKHDEINDKKAALAETRAELDKTYEKLKKEEDKLQNEIDAIIEAQQVTDENGEVILLPGKYKGGKWMCPVQVPYHVNRYGEYMAGRSYENHPGIDMSAPSGTPIHAAARGIVIKAGWNGGYGNCVVLSHGSGLTSLYGHNSSLKVKQGQVVKKGQVIALMGSTGWSTGPHCHFEVKQNGVLRNPRDFAPIHGVNS